MQVVKPSTWIHAPIVGIESYMWLELYCSSSYIKL